MPSINCQLRNRGMARTCQHEIQMTFWQPMHWSRGCRISLAVFRLSICKQQMFITGIFGRRIGKQGYMSMLEILWIYNEHEQCQEGFLKILIWISNLQRNIILGLQKLLILRGGECRFLGGFGKIFCLMNTLLNSVKPKWILLNNNHSDILSF